MLSAKRLSDGKVVEAYFESHRNAPFYCLECGDEVILKTGGKRINHFAHANPLACWKTASESETHRKCKTEIFLALRREPHATDVRLERPLDTVRPDVSAYFHGVPVAIEVQISALSMETILARTIEYHRKGIAVLWLVPWHSRLDAPRYAPKVFERWLHACYFGRVYYWLEGLTVAAYEFEPSFQKIPQKSWYSKEGRKMTGGGYSRPSERYRTPVRGQIFNLATDFVPKDRLWWEGGGIKVPDAKLFMQ